jgi:hypothetical protein
MWKKLAIAVVSILALDACAGPAINSVEAARLDGLERTPISQGACDGIGQLLPGSSLPQDLTLGTAPATLEASAAPAH